MLSNQRQGFTMLTVLTYAKAGVFGHKYRVKCRLRDDDTPNPIIIVGSELSFANGLLWHGHYCYCNYH